ncbi:MAG: MFS transporter, partial [Bacteroidetes bacterium]|nr:MFS transporter [Bacteroidota bacterium]
MQCLLEIQSDIHYIARSFFQVRMEKNDKKTLFGWYMYDWANSAYILTVVTAILPVYFTDGIVPKEGFRIGGTLYSATSLWGFAISASALFVFICAPVLGAIADFSASKKKFLLGFCFTGSLLCTLLFFCGSGDVWMTLLVLGATQICWVAANVFYDAFLPHIATEDKLDWVSGKGYAYGYVGSDIQFLICLGLILGHQTIGISSSQAVQAALVFSGLWWAGFSLFTLKYLKEAPPSEKLPESMLLLPRWAALTSIGFQRALSTLKKIRGFKHLVILLLALMLYNEGIKKVINMATI